MTLDLKERAWCVDGNARSTTIASECLPNIGLMYQSFAMCGASALAIYQRSILSAADSRASHTANPADDVPAPTNAISGLSIGASFASLGPDMSWLKMYQGYSQAMMDGSSEAFFGTWPSSGTMQSGQCYRRAPWVRHTHASACSSWPTPLETEGNGGGSAIQVTKRRMHGQIRLRDVWKHRVGTPLSIAFTEVLMGFPENWTDLGD